MKYILGLFLTIALGQLFAQNLDDVFRFSNTYIGGSSRFMGMGGSMGALGGDQSSGFINPASLGRFSKNQVDGSFGFSMVNSQLDNNLDNSSFKLIFPNISIVHTKFYEDKALKTLQLNIGYNSLQSFNQSYSFVQAGDPFSLLDDFAYYATGLDPSQLQSELPFSSYPAWYTYGIDTQDNSNYYANLYQDATVNRTVTNTIRGSLGEVNISLSGNIADKVYIGASLGIPAGSYRSNYVINEVVDQYVDSSFVNSFSYETILDQAVVGVNGKFGIIVVPVDWLRFGVSVHTPSSMTITERYTADMVTDTDTATYSTDGAGIPQAYYKYKIVKPFRAVASVGIVLMKRWSINAEFDYSNMAKANVKEQKNYQYDYSYLIDDIQEYSTATYNARIGTEFVMLPWLKLRAGFAFFDSPARYDTGDYNRYMYTGGLGFNGKAFYVDLAYVYQTGYRADIPVDFGRPSDVVGVPSAENRFQITVGYKWRK